MPTKQGVERKRGNRLGFWFFRTAVRIFGLGGAYGLLYFVALHYLLFDRAAVAASMAYVVRRFPEHGRYARIRDVYRLFVSQGKSLIDRYYVAAGGPDIALEMRGYDRIQGLLSGGKGLILLTAHVGNWQVAMTALRRLGKTVHLLMRPEDNAAVKEALNIDSGNDAVRVLSTEDALGGVVEALKAIDRGDLISIMGDRTYDFASAEASFFGSSVPFPVGAFSLAAAAQCPVVVLLTAKTDRTKYVIDVTQVIEPPSGRREKKQESIRSCVQQFASVLEDYARTYPYQWFVFRDMWKGNK
jgi:predicted LPLAT superfamily acyltransferase